MTECLTEPVGNPTNFASLSLSRRVGFLSYKLTQILLHTFEERLAAVKLTTRTYFMLSAIDREPPLSQQELSRLIGVDPTTVVALVDDLEQLGYVKRSRNRSDRRRHDLLLTAAGRRNLAAAHRVADEVEAEIFSPLTAAERDTYADLTRKVLANHWPA